MIVVALAAAASIAMGSWLPIPGGSWSPASRQVEDVRSGSKRFVESEAEKRHMPLRPWSTYTFQYQGQTSHDRRVIYVNAFCEPPPDYARRQFVDVDDGGSCYFQLRYDPAARKFVEVTFNGIG